MAATNFIKLEKISENPLNEGRSKTDEEISHLAKSITEVGLIEPLTCYKEGEDSYILISGHKRFLALKKLGFGTVECKIIEKPMSTDQEIEVMAMSNIHRNSPEQLQKEVMIVNNNWNTMPKERRLAWIKRFERDFEEENKDDPKYMVDPAKFKSNRFRPRLNYINYVTDLGVSNKTIANYLKKTLKDESEDISIPHEKKKKVLKVKDIVRSITSLNGLIDAFPYENAIPSELKSLKENLESVKEYLIGKEKL